MQGESKKIKNRKSIIVKPSNMTSCEDLKTKYETDGRKGLNSLEYNKLLRCASSENYETPIEEDK